MTTARGGLSGTAVAAAVGGAVLVYAGLRGVSPSQALRDVAGGKPPPVVGTPTAAPVNDDVVQAGLTTGAGGAGGAVAAAQKYAGDTYSQLRRRQAGYSDCSSFCDKALSDAGIPPPGDRWANTTNYRTSGEWKTISLANARPGDIAVNSHHMVLVTGAGGSSAIGQQRTGVNVRRGTVAELMGSSYVVRTYVGRAAAGSTVSA